MIFYIVILHAQKRLFWLKLTGKFKLESWLKATSSVLQRVWLLCIVGTYIICCKNLLCFLQVLECLSLLFCVLVIWMCIRLGVV
jgi:hypothetical protein